MTILGLAALTTAANAVEYVTLTSNNNSKTLDPTSVVEIVGSNLSHSFSLFRLNLTFADGATAHMGLTGVTSQNGEQSIATHNSIQGNIFTGLSSISYTTTSGTPAQAQCITLKITSAAELNKTAPATVLVLPEGTTGDHELITESSDDLVSWTTVHTQPVNSTTSSKFYRTRIVKPVAP